MRLSLALSQRTVLRVILIIRAIEQRIGQIDKIHCRNSSSWLWTSNKMKFHPLSIEQPHVSMLNKKGVSRKEGYVEIIPFSLYTKYTS
ncbi:MAG: hypothetical protein ACYC2U_07010 [Candidatus Amoebophilus sp.]